MTPPATTTTPTPQQIVKALFMLLLTDEGQQVLPLLGGLVTWAQQNPNANLLALGLEANSVVAQAEPALITGLKQFENQVAPVLLAINDAISARLNTDSASALATLNGLASAATPAAAA